MLELRGSKVHGGRFCIAVIKWSRISVEIVVGRMLGEKACRRQKSWC